MTTVEEYIAELPKGTHVRARTLVKMVHRDLGVELSVQQMTRRYIEKAPNLVVYSYRSVGCIYEVV